MPQPRGPDRETLGVQRPLPPRVAADRELKLKRSKYPAPTPLRVLQSADIPNAQAHRAR